MVQDRVLVEGFFNFAEINLRCHRIENVHRKGSSRRRILQVYSRIKLITI